MPVILISDHARQRFADRFPCSPTKYAKLAQKAWASTDVPTRAEINLDKGKIYRKLMGRVFVFVKDSAGITLVTIAPVATSMMKRRQKLAKSLNRIDHAGRSPYAAL